MKNRIREFMHQATSIEETYPAGCNGYPTVLEYFNKEKFAELIIKECAIIANRAENSETETRCVFDIITDHFGVTW